MHYSEISNYEEIQDLFNEINLENANWEFTLAFEEEAPVEVNVSYL